MSTNTIHAVIRVPHTMPAQMYTHYPERESDEYDSFWDDASSIYRFYNDDEIKAFLQFLKDDIYPVHQKYRLMLLIVNYLEIRGIEI